MALCPRSTKVPQQQSMASKVFGQEAPRCPSNKAWHHQRCLDKKNQGAPAKKHGITKCAWTRSSKVPQQQSMASPRVLDWKEAQDGSAIEQAWHSKPQLAQTHTALLFCCLCTSKVSSSNGFQTICLSTSLGHEGLRLQSSVLLCQLQTLSLLLSRIIPLHLR